MKTRLLGKMLIFVTVSLACSTAWAEPGTRADQVTDDVSLKAFVLDAKEYTEGLTSLEEIARIRSIIRTEGEWPTNSNFIIRLASNGTVLQYGGECSAASRNLFEMTDDRGGKIVQEMLDIAEKGGGFVEYHDGVAKKAYAVKYFSGLSGRPCFLAGSCNQDVSSASPAAVSLPRPVVTATEVVDRDTLVAFVGATAREYQKVASSTNLQDVVGHRNAFREEGGYWKSGSVYF